jgi:predicted N-formylglutamate amidohydrolase
MFDPMSMATSASDFKPVELIAGAMNSGVLFLCDHARNVLPPSYQLLGMGPAQLERHIAYDIGAETITRRLAEHFSAPAVVATYSRLLIDPNRGADDPTLVMRLSDGAIVPGNAAVDSREIEYRRRHYWQPYRDAIRDQVQAMMVAGCVPAIVSIHSFTQNWKANFRPWHVGVLWDKDPRMAVPFLAALASEADIVAGDNQPYDGALEGDTLYESATQRGLANLLIEMRQDLVARNRDAHLWGDRLARLLAPVLALPETHIVHHYGSRVQARKARWSVSDDRR